MGNAQLKVGGDLNDLLITTSLLQNFKKHVTSVDHAVTGLVRGIDALQSTCKLFLQQKEKNTAEEHKGTMASAETEVLIIQKIHECISNNREITVESLRNFFNFFKDIGQTYIVNADEAFSSLSVNSYKQGHSEEKTPHDWFTEFYKRRLEQLKADIELLQKSNDLQKKEIENLKKQSTLFTVKDILAKELKDWPDPTKMQDKIASACELDSTNDASLKTPVEQSCTNVQPTQTLKQNPIEDDRNDVEECSDNNTTRKKSAPNIDTNQTVYKQSIKDLHKLITSLQQEKTMMKSELLNKEQIINMLSKRKLLVQIFRKTGFTPTTAYTAEKDLLQRIKSEFLQRDLVLEVVRCEGLGQVTDKLPLLIIISHMLFNTKNSNIDFAMNGIDIAENRAVVVFHSKAEKDLPHELEQYDKVIPSLGGVFHFGYIGSLHNSAINKENTENIITFIEKYGKVQTIQSLITTV